MVVINTLTHTNYRNSNRFRNGLSPGGIPEFKFNLPHHPHIIGIQLVSAQRIRFTKYNKSE